MMPIIWALLAITAAPIASAQGIGFDTGGAIKEALRYDPAWSGSLGQMLQWNIEGRAGKAILIGVAGDQILGSNVNSSSGTSINYGGVNIGLNLEWKYRVDDNGKIILSYRITTGIGIFQNDIDTGLRTFIFREPPSDNRLPPRSTFAPPQNGRGTFQTLQINYEYGYMGGDGKYYVVSTAVSITVWVPEGESPADLMAV